MTGDIECGHILRVMEDVSTDIAGKILAVACGALMYDANNEFYVPLAGLLLKATRYLAMLPE